LLTQTCKSYCVSCLLQELFIDVYFRQWVSWLPLFRLLHKEHLP
jgi:hypothetical protein